VLFDQVSERRTIPSQYKLTYCKAILNKKPCKFDPYCNFAHTAIVRLIAKDRINKQYNIRFCEPELHRTPFCHYVHNGELRFMHISIKNSKTTYFYQIFHSRDLLPPPSKSLSRPHLQHVASSTLHNKMPKPLPAPVPAEVTAQEPEEDLSAFEDPKEYNESLSTETEHTDDFDDLSDETLRFLGLDH
jgi:hypothetical protein